MNMKSQRKYDCQMESSEFEERWPREDEMRDWGELLLCWGFDFVQFSLFLISYLFFVFLLKFTKFEAAKCWLFIKSYEKCLNLSHNSHATSLYLQLFLPFSNFYWYHISTRWSFLLVKLQDCRWKSRARTRAWPWDAIFANEMFSPVIM